MSSIIVRAISPADLEGYHAALDQVARERRYLTLLEAPPLEAARSFVAHMSERGDPQFVALCEGRVVGWCDIMSFTRPAHAHVGTLGMGIVVGHRGAGIGRRLIKAALEAASRRGLQRIELNVYTGNTAAIALYRGAGFKVEGTMRAYAIVDGQALDALMMARIDMQRVRDLRGA